MSETNQNRLPSFSYKPAYNSQDSQSNSYHGGNFNATTSYIQNPVMSISKMTDQINANFPMSSTQLQQLQLQHAVIVNANNSATQNNPQFRGPPKTSRFFKTLPTETNRADGAPTQTTHHYNPYLYPQQKTKATPPLDLLNLGTRLTINEDELLSPHITDSNMIPTYRLNEKQFEDPIKFIESVKEVGQKYGAIKIIPPSNWECQFSINTELFWFRSRRQLLNSEQSELQARMSFHSRLIRFHQTKNTSLGKLPSIDKRLLDLYRLRICVKLRGGFETVCQRKLWAQIGRELGYSGKIMTSLSSSLKSAYQRYILQFDLYEEKLSSDGNNTLNENNKRSSTTEKPELHQSKKYKLNDLLNNDDESNDFDFKNNKPKTEINEQLSNTNRSHATNIKRTSLILGSAKEFNRPRRKLISKGFPTNFDNLTEFKTSITKHDSKTLPSYDFYKWYENEIIDTSPFDKKLAPLYNLRQFYDKNLKFQEFILNNYYISKKPTINELESLYWRFLSDSNINYEVECGIKINSMIHDSGFNVLNLNNDSSMNNQSILNNNKKISLHPFNLNNLPILPNSILSYLGNDCTNVTKPNLSIGMMFSCENWAQEDHYLNMVNYHHLGDCKVWYFIPSDEQVKFEKLVKETISENDTQRENVNNLNLSSTLVDSNFKPCDLEFLNCSLENKIPIDLNNKRLNHKNSFFDKLIDRTEKIQYNQDFFLSPEILAENGINFYKAVQQPGQYIIKFPRVYSSNISLGFTTSEEVNFATPSWLNYSLEGEKWLLKQGILPNFSTFKLITNVIDNCKDLGILRVAEPIYNALVNEELELRHKFRTLFPTVKETTKCDLINDDDYISDDDLSNGFPTRVLLVGGDSSSFIMSLRNFLKKFAANPKLEEFSNIELQSCYSDDKLKSYLKLLQSNILDKNDWLKKFNETLSNAYRPSLKTLKLLLIESERIKEPIPEAIVLKGFISDSNKFIEDCQNLLSIKHQQRIRNGNKRKLQQEQEKQQQVKVDKPRYQENTLYRLTSLIDEIPKLNFYCIEMDQLIEFQQEVENFEKSVRVFLSDGSSHSITDFDEMISLGESFGIELNSIKFLTRIRDIKLWFERENYASNVIHDLDELKKLFEEGKKILGRTHLSAYNALEQRISESEVIDAKIKSKLKEPKIDIEELESLTKTSGTDGKLLALSTDVTEKLDDLITSHYEIYDKVQECIGKNIKDFSILKPLFRKLNSLRTFRRISDIDSIKSNIDETESWISTLECKLNTKNLLNQLDLIIKKNQFNFSIIIDDVYEKNEDDPEYNKIFCLCREYESGTMIECEICKEWYHVKCLKLIGLKDDYIFNCPICNDNFKIDSTLVKVNIKELERSLEEALSLSVQPKEEIIKLKQIVHDYSTFKKSVLKNALEWNDEKLIEEDLNKLKFFLRKLAGSFVLLDDSAILKRRINELLSRQTEPPDVAAVSDTDELKDVSGVSGDHQISDSETKPNEHYSNKAFEDDKDIDGEAVLQKSEVESGAREEENLNGKVEKGLSISMFMNSAEKIVKDSKEPTSDSDDSNVGVVFKFDPFKKPLSQK